MDEEEEELKNFAQELQLGLVKKKKYNLPGINGQHQQDLKKQILRQIKLAQVTIEPHVA